MYRFAAAILLPGALAGQAILQHAVASGAGAVAGSAVGRQLSTVLDAVNKVTVEASKGVEPKTTDPKMKEGGRVAPDGAVKPTAGPHAIAAPRPAAAAGWFAQPGVPDANPADLRAIEPGTSRDRVLDKLGTPSSRVTIPDNGRFLEIYYYQAKGETVGSVRLTDGEVTLVQLSR